ncbi:hypothetical protein [Mesorhizobium abyssinicae]|uniref:hypothetical protein n=1 Tax=Mesorhizobium abyssinicae TaxID=1209958 RepID=UPI003392AB12
MTLVLALAASGIVVQVGDRLVSEKGSFKAVDEIATKQLLYRAKDAIVSIAYAGQAMMAGVPTDEMMAAHLSGDANLGKRNSSDRFSFKSGGQNNNFWPLKHALGHLLRKLTSHLSVGSSLELSIAGFTVAAGEAKPFIQTYKLYPDGKRKLERPPRNQNGVWLSAIGMLAPNLLESVLYALEKEQPTADQLSAFLTDQIRRFGGPGIGSNTSAISIPLGAPVVSEFFPLTPHKGAIVGGAKSIEFEAIHHPWIVGQQILKAPTLGSGGDWHFHEDGLDVVLKGASAKGDGLLGAMGSVPRFPLAKTIGPNFSGMPPSAP